MSDVTANVNVIALSDILTEFPTLHSGKLAKLLGEAQTPFFLLNRNYEGGKVEVLTVKRNKPRTIPNILFLDPEHVREIVNENRVELAPDSATIKPNRNPTLDEVMKMTPEQIQLLQRQAQARVKAAQPQQSATTA